MMSRLPRLGAALLGGLAVIASQPGCAVDPNPIDNPIASIEVFGNSEVAVDASITLHTLRKDAAGTTISTGAESVTWSSSNATVASVSSTGVVTGVQEGTATITARVGSATGTKAILVTQSAGAVATVAVSGPASLRATEAGTFTAVLRDAGGHVVTRPITWSSSDATKATVNDVTGVVTANATGTVTITATSEGKSGTAQLSVTPAPVARVELLGGNPVAVGQTMGVVAHLYDIRDRLITDTRTITWSSSDVTRATVSNGDVTGVAVGTATITATCEGKSGTFQVTVVAAAATVRISGRVVDYLTNNGIGGAGVFVFRTDGIVTGASATTNGDGTFLTDAFTPPTGGVFVEGIKSGYVTGRIMVTALSSGGTIPTEPIPLVPVSAQKGAISGVVRDARTNAPIPGASLALYNNQQSAPVAPATADASGNYTFSDLNAGTYRVTATAANYQLNERVGIAVGNGGVTGNQDLILSPSGTNDIRIVLTWGSSPNDLDSHLTGPAGASRFHVYYASRGSFDAAPFAGLDIDDVSAFGPETISITQMGAGNYRYSVHDFTNRNSATSSALGNSGARVRVYTSTGLVLDRSVPTGTGNLWTVFEMTGTLANPVFTIRNEMSFATDPSGIPAPQAGLRAGAAGRKVGTPIVP